MSEQCLSEQCLSEYCLSEQCHVPVYLWGLTIGESNETEKMTEFDLFVLEILPERELRHWQPGVSFTVVYNDTV